MDIRTFYSLVLPSTGTFCLMSPKAAHYWYDNIDELIAGTEQHTYDEPNWYFGTCGFDGQKRRKQENVVAARSLRLDLDAGEKKLAKHGPEKVYATQKEALAHAVEFIKWSKLKPTIIVSSGEGLHLYYCFDQDFPSMDVWLKCATALEQMAQTFKLKADPSVTKDSARVLRPVGALHSNGKHISVLAAYQTVTLPQFIGAYKELAPTLVKPAPVAAKPRGINADIQGPVMEVPSSMKVAAEKCAFVRESLEAEGNVDYMPWLNMLALFKYSVEGEDGAHAWSSGHPEYDFGATQAKLDSLDKAPPRCSKISDDFPGCRSCPQFSKNSTPNLFGRLNDRQQIELAKAAKAQAAASPASAADSDDGFGSGFTDGGDDATESDGGGFATFDELPDGDVAAAIGAAKFDEALALAKQHDKTAELVATGKLPATWKDPAQVSTHTGEGAAFFIALTTQGRMCLGCFHRVEIKGPDGEKTTTYQKILLTNQPFSFREYVDGGFVIVDALDQYDAHRGNAARWTEHEVSSADASDEREFRKFYTGHGIMTLGAGGKSEREVLRLMNVYSRANLALLRDFNNGESFGKRLGFQFLNEKPVYVQGAYKIGHDGKLERCFLTGPLKRLKKAYELKQFPSEKLGGYPGDAYADIVMPRAAAYCQGIRKAYGLDAGDVSKPFAFGWLLGVASPYLAFTTRETPTPEADMPTMGFAVSLYSEGSGIGKTQLQRCIMRAWGEPDESKAGGDSKSGASTIAVGVNMAARGSLPFMLDEASNKDGKEVSDLLHKISQGQDKVRAKRDGTLSETGGWTSISTVSTNVSLRNLVANLRDGTNAEQMRVLEIDFDVVDKTKLNKKAFDAVYDDLISPNVGALGLVLGRYGAVNFTSMRERGVAMVNAVFDQFGLNQEERYFAIAYAAAKLTAEVLAEYGILPVNMDQMDEMFGQYIQTLRGYLTNTSMSPVAYATEMLRELNPRILLTHTETDRRKDDAKGFDEILNERAFDHKVVAGRRVLATGRVYIVATELRDWAEKRGVDYRTLEREWLAAGIMLKLGEQKTFTKLLTTGVAPAQVPPIRARVVMLDTNKLAADSVEEPVPDNVVELHATRGQSDSAAAAAPAENNGTGE